MKYKYRFETILLENGIELPDGIIVLSSHVQKRFPDYKVAMEIEYLEPIKSVKGYSSGGSSESTS